MNLIKLLILMIAITILPLLMLLMNFFLMSKHMNMREKNSTFECGFQPMSKQRLPFSLQFFFISIIFLIFDVEMTLLFPMIKNINMINLVYWIITSILIFIILLIGLYIEWMNNLIKWFN
uniref:NADH dehydrogenase subunit 3 n=1 Tax=Platygaster robiniae TaxID=2753657 RepID=UPI0021146453|nr:NADH dehydrogenase subunit 3 [Platygaster robiniae]UTI38870.1 NADH dehydrogenase subunit 3 [Platygaster robiniae]